MDYLNKSGKILVCLFLSSLFICSVFAKSVDITNTLIGSYRDPTLGVGYADLGFTESMATPLVSAFVKYNPNNSSHKIEGIVTSGVYRNPISGTYLFFYNIALSPTSDPIDGFAITGTGGVPLFAEAISAAGYDTYYTAGHSNLIPTTVTRYEPPPPPQPFIDFRFYNGDGISPGMATEIFYIINSPYVEISAAGKGRLTNSVSASVSVEFGAYSPPSLSVPEPATLLLLAGILVLGSRRIVRRH